MPDDTATLGRALALAQACHDPARGTMLLVAGDDLDPLAVGQVHEDAAAAQDVKQRLRVEEALDQLLLRPHRAERWGDRRIALGPDTLPGVEVLGPGADGAGIRRLAAAAHQKEVRVEEPRLALSQASRTGRLAGVAIACQLGVGLVHRVRGGGAADLRLDHDERQAVHEQHDVGNDEWPDPARRVDAELVDRVEAVAFRAVEVDQPHRRVLLAGHLVAVDLRLEQQLLHRLVGLEQRARWAAEDVVEQACQLALGQPLPSVRRRVERPHCLAEHVRQVDLREARSQAPRRIARHDPRPGRRPSSPSLPAGRGAGARHGRTRSFGGDPRLGRGGGRGEEVAEESRCGATKC